LTVSLPWTVMPFRLALIVTTVDAWTGLVATLTLANQLPDWATAVAGTLAIAGLLLARLTTIPLLGAAPDRCASPEVAKPPTAGTEKVSDCKVGGCTMIVVEDDVPFIDAVRVTGVGTETAPMLN